MTFKTIDARNEIKKRLDQAQIKWRPSPDEDEVLVPIVYPNVAFAEHNPPYITMAHAQVTQMDDTLAGGERLEERGIYDFAITVPYGQGERLSAELCDKVKAVYPSGSYWPFMGGVIQIPTTPSVGAMAFSGQENAIGFVMVSYIASSI